MKEFIKLIASYGIINVFQKAVDYLSVILFISVFSTDEYGVISLNTIIILSLTSIISLSLESAVTRYYYKFKKSNELKMFIGSITSYLIIIIIIVSALLFLFTKPIFAYFFNEIKFSPYIIIAILISALDPINRLYFGYLQIKKDIKEYAIYYNAYVLTKLVSLMIVSYFFVSVELYFYTYLISILIFTLLSLRKLNKIIIWNLNVDYFIYSLTYSIYFLPVILLAQVNSLVDRTFVLDYINLSSVGVYSAGANIGKIVLLVATVLNASYIPFFLQSYEKDKKLFIEDTKNYSDIIISTLLIISFVFSLLTPLLNGFISGSYSDVVELIPIFTFVGVSNGLYFYYTNFLSLERKLMKYKFIGLLVGVLLNITITYFLVKNIGMLGAAIGTLLSIFSSSVILKIIVVKIGKYKLSNKYLLTSLLMFFITIVLMYLSKHINISVLIVVDVIVMVIAFVLLDYYFFKQKRFLSLRILKIIKDVRYSYFK